MNNTQLQTQHIKTFVLLPVFFSFFIVGFCDAVGISSNYVKMDFGLSETQASLLPSMVFIWFLLFSVPVGTLMNRIGRKATVLTGIAITSGAMLMPVLNYSFEVVLLAFALLGIGNVVLQVAVNPLLSSVVTPEKLTASLTGGQFVKAICSFSAPMIAAFAASRFGNWQLIFPVFAGVSLLAFLWLLLTPVPEQKQADAAQTTLWQSFRLLSDKVVLRYFLGILCVVGLDVAINTFAPKYLMERCGLSLNDAGFATSIYFIFRTVSALISTFLLMRFSPQLYFRVCMLLTLGALVLLFFAQSQWLIFASVALIGFAGPNVFTVIFGEALRYMPAKANEISGLLIMGVSGGAVMPLLMGMIAQYSGMLSPALLVPVLCVIYLIRLTFR
jgi:fucose permease